MIKKLSVVILSALLLVSLSSCGKKEDTAKKEQPKAVETKAEEAKAEHPKAEETKAEQPKAEEAKPEHPSK